MACQHLTIKRAVRGQRADCIKCHIPVIFDGTKWHWYYALSMRERDAMTREFDLEQIRSANHG